MKEIKLLWLYDDLLDLYGDNGNIRMLDYYLNKQECALAITSASIHDTLSFSGYDMVYCGPGKLKNLIVASSHLRQYKEELKVAIEQGTVMLFTGNAMLLLGESFSDVQNNQYEACGIFPFTAHDENRIEIADVLSVPVFAPDTAVYGFINRTARIQNGVDLPALFTVKKGIREQREGILYKNLWATWQLGPVLVKNPFLLTEIMKKLTGHDSQLDNALEKEAYKRTIEELKK